MTLERSRPEGCLSDLRLDELMLGELTERDAQDTRAHIATCDRCRERLDALEADRAAFAPPPLQPRTVDPAQARQSSRRETPGKRAARAKLWTATGGALAAAAAILLYLNVQPASSPRSDPARATRTKGAEPHMGFYVKHDGAVREGQNGEIVRPGDALRFTYTTPAPTHLALISIDGAGKLSVYHPDGERLQRTAAGNEVALPHAIVLDDVLGTERIYATFCDGPRRVSELTEAVEASPDEPQLPGGCSLQRITIEKRQ